MAKKLDVKGPHGRFSWPFSFKICAYLNNYIDQGEKDPFTDKVYQYYIDEAPVFVKVHYSTMLFSYLSSRSGLTNMEYL